MAIAFQMRAIAGVSAALVAIATLGCNGSGVELVPVSGVVTLNGKAPPAAGEIYFTPLEGTGGSLRPSSTSFDKSGSYAAQSFSAGAGLPPGKYRLAVHCWEKPPTMTGSASKSFIPERYTVASTSHLVLDVPAGSGSIDHPIELKSP